MSESTLESSMTYYDCKLFKKITKKSIYLPQWSISFHRNIEMIAVIISANGVNAATKRGPFFSTTQSCNQQVTPVTTTPCNKTKHNGPSTQQFANVANNCKPLEATFFTLDLTILCQVMHKFCLCTFFLTSLENAHPNLVKKSDIQQILKCSLKYVNENEFSKIETEHGFT